MTLNLWPSTQKLQLSNLKFIAIKSVACEQAHLRENWGKEKKGEGENGGGGGGKGKMSLQG